MVNKHSYVVSEIIPGISAYPNVRHYDYQLYFKVSTNVYNSTTCINISISFVYYYNTILGAYVIIVFKLRHLIYKNGSYFLLHHAQRSL